MWGKKIIRAMLVILLTLGIYGGCSNDQHNDKDVASVLTTASEVLSGDTSYQLDGDMTITYTAEGLKPFNANIPYQAKAEFEPEPIFWTWQDITEYAEAMGAPGGIWVLESYTTNDRQYFHWGEEGWTQAPVESRLSPVEGASLLPEDLVQFFSTSTSKTTVTTTDEYTEYNLTLDQEYLAEFYLNDASRKDRITGDMVVQINNQTGYPNMLRLHTAGTATAGEGVNQDFGFELTWTLKFSNYGAVFGLTLPPEALNAPPYQEMDSSTNQ